MSRNSNRFSVFLGTIFFLMLPSVVFAEPQVTPMPADRPPELDGEMLQRFLDNVVYRYVYPIAGLICFIFIVKGGYMWMMSSGDPDKVKQAQGTLTWSVIGLIFVVITRLLMGVILDAIA